jgi:glycerophosphoryl diester phosphodiesterase
MKTIMAILLLAVIPLFSSLTEKENRSINTPQMNKSNHHIKIIAHRGGANLAPENTLAAFREAIGLGVDMIEIDVHLSKDGHIMVIHDFTLDRTTTGKGKVVDMTLDEIRKYDAGVKFSEKFRGEKVPTLDETMELLNGKTGLLIEIKKDKDDQYPGIEEKVVETIHKYKAKSWVIVQSFNKYAILQTNKIDPSLTTFYLASRDFDGIYNKIAQQLSAGETINKEYDGIAPHFSRLNAEKVKTFQKAGLKLFTWTVDKPADMKRVIGWQVNGIITNSPDKLIELLNK